MSEDLEQRVMPAIARLAFEGSPRSGTAFYIGGRHAVTALHVVADTEATPLKFLPGALLRFEGAAKSVGATVVPGLWDEKSDWAVLELDAAPIAEPIELGPPVAKGDVWFAFGYPEVKPEGMTITGDVTATRAPGSGLAVGLYQIQLFSREAAAGMGTRLHGFSGAPCLVNGKAVGILRSTLVDELVDGEQQRHLFTQYGTAFATPCTDIVQRLAARRVHLMAGAWAPPEVAMTDFLVLLSSREPVDHEAPRTPPHKSLRKVVKEAVRGLDELTLGPPCFLRAADVVASLELLEFCVLALCRARVVVFDASGYEPAIMLLAGIRAVCRRGVTLLSVGGRFALGDELGVPFNVRDANIVVHSFKQDDSPIADSVDLIAKRIDRGLKEVESANYLDLPVFDAIRLVPPDRRGTRTPEEGLLVLCAFDKAYQAVWKKKVKKALDRELTLLRKAKPLKDSSTDIGVARSFELNSPRLVTQAVYEAIRCMQACVVDLTTWSPNVLFELGVRLAASGERSACIIERDWVAATPVHLLAQCESLASLLLSSDFVYDSKEGWEGQTAFANAYGRNCKPPPALLAQATLHSLVERALDIDIEPASRSVHEELLAQARMFSRLPGGQGQIKPAGLFPGNDELTEREASAEFERLVAAWLYLVHRDGFDKLMADAGLRKTLGEVVDALVARHPRRLTLKMKNRLNALADRIDKRSK